MSKKDVRKGIVPYLFLFLVMLGLLYFFNMSRHEVHQFTYDEFITNMEEEKIEEITIVPRSGAGVYEIEGKLEGYGQYEKSEAKRS